MGGQVTRGIFVTSWNQVKYLQYPNKYVMDNLRSNIDSHDTLFYTTLFWTYIRCQPQERRIY